MNRRFTMRRRMKCGADECEREFWICNFDQCALRKLRGEPVAHNQTRRFTLRRRIEQLLIFDVRYLALARVIEIGNPRNLCFWIAGNATTHDPGEFFNCHLMNPRFEPRIKLTRCATCSLST